MSPTGQNYQICRFCVMDTTDPDITFNDEGFCNHCRRYNERKETELHHGEEGHRELSRIADKIKSEGKGKQYDCVIGVSGGVDSTMVAYRCRELGLRPIAIHLDNGWNSELAVSNIEGTLNQLDIDLYTHVVDWNEFRDIQLSFIKASVPNLEIPTDHAITALLFREAVKRGIRYIISGSNLETEAIMPRAWVYDHRDWYHLKKIHRKFGTAPIKTFPHYNFFQFGYYFGIRKIKFLKVLNYGDSYRKEECQRVLEKLGWRNYGGKHFESIFTRFYQAHYLPKKFGFDKRRAHLSTLICSGQISRKSAIEELNTEGYPDSLLKEDREFFKKKFLLSDEDYSGLFKSELHSHTDYPSHEFLFLRNKFGLLNWARSLVGSV